MKQSLQLKIGQQLTMTPQLQQAIKLLQLSTLDLQQEIQQALESNPMLEVSEDSEEPHKKDSDSKNEELIDLSQDNDNSDSNSKQRETEGDAPDSDWPDQEIPEDLPVDTRWDDVYTNNAPTSGSAPADSDFDFDSRNSAEETLQDHRLHYRHR